MINVKHESNNITLGKPAHWPESVTCDQLAATKTSFAGLAVTLSFWQPTLSELALLNAGEPLMLWVAGESMPPITIGVHGD